MTPRRYGLLAVLLATLALYARALDRGFVSEDFSILRHLGRQDLWSALGEQLRGPWLGVTLARFYRPLSTGILALERVVFGTWSTGYTAFHVLVHLLNVALVARIVGRLLPGRPPAVALGAALVFAVYPYSANAVLFIGAFATLFCASGCLVTIALFVEHLRGGGRAAFAAALVATVAALGMYEAAAVLPALLLSIDCLLPPREGDAPRTLRARFLRALPFGVLVGAYLLLRGRLLGATIAGYEEVQRTLDAGQLRGLASKVPLDWRRLFAPAIDGPPLWLGVTVGVVLVAGLAASVVRRRAPEARLAWLALLWIGFAQLPFSAVSVTPAIGRYWYLPAAGVALLVIALPALLAPERWRTRAAVASALVVASGYAVLLHGLVGYHVEAGRIVAAVQRELGRAAAEAPGTTLFVSGVPEHLVDAASTPVAQVFHWGLHDCMQPPFREEGVGVYPLPAAGLEHLASALVGVPSIRWLRWDADTEHLVPGDEPSAEVAVLATLPDPERPVRFERVRGARRYRVTLLAPLQHTVWVTPGRRDEAGIAWSEVPGPFVATVSHFDPERALYWWVEAEGTQGETLAVSRLATLR